MGLLNDDINDFVEGRIMARVYRYTQLLNSPIEMIVHAFECLSANGKSELGKVGSGELVAATAHAKSSAGVQKGDIVTVVQETALGRFGASPTTTRGQQRIACFVVRNMTEDGGNGTITISGDDLLSELQDYVAVSPVGAATEVATYVAQRNEGRRTFTLMAAYFAGTTRIVIYGANRERVFEGDQVHITLSDGGVFIAEIQDIVNFSAQPLWVEVELRQPIPRLTKEVQAWGTYCYLYTPRIRTTTNAENIFDVGGRLWVVTDDRTADGQYVVFRSRVDGFETKQDEEGNEQYYVRLETAPIQTIPVTDPLNPPQHNPLVSTVYDTPTTTDIADLLKDTFSRWSVSKRDADCTIGTTYEPSGESVWDALSALLETTGYTVKHTKNWANPRMPDLRQVRVLNPSGKNLTTGTMIEVRYDRGLRTGTYEPTIGRMLGAPRMDMEGYPVTHCIPHGAGGGQSQFDLTAADLSVLDPYNAAAAQNGYVYKLSRHGSEWVLFRDRLPGGAIERPVWRAMSFPQIRPIDEGNTYNARAAANQLLIAAVEFLEESRRDNLAIEVDIFTPADPQPGDRIARVFSNLNTEAAGINQTDMLLVTVEHKATVGKPRLTSITMTKNRTVPETGIQQMARQVNKIARRVANANMPTAGGTRFYDNRIVFRGDGIIGTSAGVMSVQSQSGDVEVRAAGRVYINADSDVRVNSSVMSNGLVRATDGLEMFDDNFKKWLHVPLVIDGVPRMVITNVTDHISGDEPEPDPFSISGVSLY